MSLRTLYLEELNALAKAKSTDFASKVREVMVDRHPATLDPDEQDPVDTVALAWKEVAPRGRATFEDYAKRLITDMDRARVYGDAVVCDWPLGHATLRLLAKLPDSLVNADMKKLLVRLLSGLVVEREDFIARVRSSYVAAPALWLDAVRLYLLWHHDQPSMLQTIWETALNSGSHLPEEVAFPILQDAAISHPTFITFDRLVTFWKAGKHRNVSVEDLKRWFYVIGALLENSTAGKEVLADLHGDSGGYLQDCRNNDRNLGWDHFVEVFAAIFRSTPKKQDILRLKSPSKLAQSTHDRQMNVPQKFKAKPDTVRFDLFNSLLQPA